MTQTYDMIDELLRVHHDLWDMKSKVNYFAGEYPIYTSDTRSYSKVLLPGRFGKDVLFITQDLDISTYGTLEIQRAQRKGEVVRITWIVDPQEGRFNYIGLIKTTPNMTLIERYTHQGDTITMYSDDLINHPILT